ncbi:MAG: hypothetical protein ACXIUO_00870 [Erythrobacter sp.]
MAKKFALPLLAFAALAIAPLGQAQAQSAGDIVVKAPANLTLDSEKDWFKLRRQDEKLRKQVADREKRVAREERNVAKQQRSVADAQKRLDREQSRLSKAERNLSREMSRRQSDSQELAKVQERMIAMGGVRAIKSAPQR